MSNYKISVIIPTCNCEDYLVDCVKSIINQTFGFKNIELILIDDNSNDSTKDIIQYFTSKYLNCKSVFLKESSGSGGKPRNIGIEKVSAKYLMFLGDFDIISVIWLQSPIRLIIYLG